MYYIQEFLPCKVCLKNKSDELFAEKIRLCLGKRLPLSFKNNIPSRKTEKRLIKNCFFLFFFSLTCV